MLRVLSIVGLAMLSFSGTSPASSEPVPVARPPALPAFMRVFRTTPPPFGFISFCERFPGECVPGPVAATRLETSALRLSELDEINRFVNTRIKPKTDLELYGVPEHWTLPTVSGDCEDYALLKRHILMRRGWPSSALLMTVVRDEKGEGHAVLTARTAQGDYILDNKVPDIRIWHRATYRFVMRQSYVDPRVWVSLTPDGPERGGAIASSQQR